MTAEVAVANRSAIALAADSAVTVEAFSRGRMTQKVFNTANKLFTLSKFTPMGIMVYNTMTLGGVPWETVVKEHRRHLDRSKLPTVEAYCDSFFSFLRNNGRLFDEEDQKQVLVHILFGEFARVFHGCDTENEIKEALERQCSELSSKDPVQHFDNKFLVNLDENYGGSIDRAAELTADPVQLTSTKSLARRFGLLVLSRKEALSGYSGVVFAGFGEDEIYPRLRHYTVDAIINNEVKYRFDDEWKIAYRKQSFVLPFADRESVRSMLEGVSPSYGRRFYQEAARMIAGLPEAIINGITELSEKQKEEYIKSSGGAAISAFHDLIEKMNQHRVEEYSDPIYRAIAMMPMSELAVVAEVFVNLSQIKQRMSLETETVGGPIDVAVISKGDGFVWIKRKHYFSQELNPFFLEKYMSKNI
jgi:hypothetical protein